MQTKTYIIPLYVPTKRHARPLLVTDLFFGKGIRGGITTITNRCSKANNKYMKGFDPQPIVQVHSNLNWLTSEEIKEMMPDHSKIETCTLEVDLEYPQELHNLHSDYPLSPETLL